MGGKQWTGAGVRSGGPQRASARLIPTRAPLSGAAASSAMSRSGRARSSSGTSSSCFEMYERAQHASVTTLGSGRKSRPARWRTARVLSRVRGKQSEIAPRSRRDRDEIATRSRRDRTSQQRHEKLGLGRVSEAEKVGERPRRRLGQRGGSTELTWRGGRWRQRPYAVAGGAVCVRARQATCAPAARAATRSSAAARGARSGLRA